MAVIDDDDGVDVVFDVAVQGEGEGRRSRDTLAQGEEEEEDMAASL